MEFMETALFDIQHVDFELHFSRILYYHPFLTSIIIIINVLCYGNDISITK